MVKLGCAGLAFDPTISRATALRGSTVKFQRVGAKEANELFILGNESFLYQICNTYFGKFWKWCASFDTISEDFIKFRYIALCIFWEMSRNYDNILSKLSVNLAKFPPRDGLKGKSERTKVAWPKNAEPKMLREPACLSARRRNGPNVTDEPLNRKSRATQPKMSQFS